MSRIHEALRRTAQQPEPSAAVGEGSLILEGGSPHPLDSTEASHPVQPAHQDPVLSDHGSASRNGRDRRLDVKQLADEELVKLVQRVFLVPNRSAPRVVVFSSIDRPCGSSSICFRAGEILAAHTARSVCLVDANLRAPVLHGLAGVDRSPGFADAVLSPGRMKQFSVRIRDGNLWCVPAGSAAAQASGLFSCERFASGISEMRQAFEYVLIDAPPIDSYSDTVLLGQMADGLILIIEANATRREKARTVKETLAAAKVNLLGAILNNRTFPIPELLYRRL
jgi:Mrp family chromosome partitioning ATPase